MDPSPFVLTNMEGNLENVILILLSPYNPGYATLVLYTGGHQIKNGLEDGFCKNYIKLYNIKITKKLGEDKI
jgi:hypothetical protein